VTWTPNSPTAAHLVALDIVAFSRRMHSDTALLAARSALMRATEDSGTFATWLPAGGTVMQFLGDELRVACKADVIEERQVFQFTAEVLRNLESFRNYGVTDIEARGAIVHGIVAVKRWRGAEYIDGPTVHKLNRLLGSKLVQSGQIVMDRVIAGALHIMAGTQIHEHAYGGETVTVAVLGR
jgi:hypothetical protein